MKAFMRKGKSLKIISNLDLALCKGRERSLVRWMSSFTVKTVSA